VRFSRDDLPELGGAARHNRRVAPIAACNSTAPPAPSPTRSGDRCRGGSRAADARSRLLLPTLWLGAIPTPAFRGTLSAEVDTALTMLCDLLVPLLDDGLTSASAPERPRRQHRHDARRPAAASTALPRSHPRRGVLLGTGGARVGGPGGGARKSMGHACEFETQ